MNVQKLPVIIFFNVIITMADIVLLSGLMSMEWTMKLIVLAVSIVVFIAGNYLLLSRAFKKPMVKDKANANADDYEDVFKGWKGMKTPFGGQIDIALKQIEQLKTRKSKLKALSADDTFESAVDEVQTNMFANFNRIINKLLICDKADSADVRRGLEYINSALAVNAQYLEVFRKFIDEVAMMGDTSDLDGATLSLQTITESLREIRTNGTAGSDDSL